MTLFNHVDSGSSWWNLFHYVDYVVINGSDAEITNINAGGTDVAARTVSADITLTDAELAAALAAADNSVAVMQASATAAEKLDVAQTILDAQIASYDASTAATRDQFLWKAGVQEYVDILAKLTS